MQNLTLIILGRGRMAQAVTALAGEKDVQTVGMLGRDGIGQLPTLAKAHPAAVVLELTRPEAAPANVAAALRLGLPVVCGTTGWDAQRPDIEELCREVGGAFLYASNFSPAMNLAFALARQIGAITDHFPGYILAITETHHTRKLDAPSGTAITLAEQALAGQSQYMGWQGRDIASGKKSGTPPYLPVEALREGEVIGDHTLTLEGPYESLTLRHQAQDRRVFAEGALAASKWIIGRKGVFGMEDVLGL